MTTENEKQHDGQFACLECGSNNIGVPANYDSLISSAKTKPNDMNKERVDETAVSVHEPVGEIVDFDGYAHVVWKSSLRLPVGTKFYLQPPKLVVTERKCDNCGEFGECCQKQAHSVECCTWKQHDDTNMPDTWEADCGAMWTFTEGGPKANDMKFCPNCGKPTIETDNRIKE